MTQRHVLVIGMAKSGVAAARLLALGGDAVRLSDRKVRSELTGLEALDGLEGLEWRLGEPAEELLDGMDMLVVSPGVPLENPAVREAERRGLPVIGELELAARRSQGRLIAVTGTNGKTTTTALTGEIFKNAGKLAHVVGNIGDPFAGVARDVKPDDVVVCEVSSFQLETVDGFHPEIAAILNITEDHLNRHGTMAAYAALKARVFEKQTAKDAVVLNYDDPALRALADAPKGRVVWFSRRETPPYGAFVDDGRIVFGDRAANRTVCRVEDVRIPGLHNLENALAACAIAMTADVPAPVVRHTLRTFQGVEHRIEFAREVSGVRFINDSKGTNADSVLKAIATMESPTVILLGGFDKKVDFAGLCEAIAHTPLIERAILIGECAPQFERQLREAGYTRFEHMGRDFKGAIERAYAIAEPGWNVLLSPGCASFDMFKDFEERGDAFKHIVSELGEKPA